MSKINKGNYYRDLSKDKETINFYRSYRNTIHNLGINKQKHSSSQVVKGIQISLNANEASYTENHNAGIFLCEELVEIYSAIINNLSLFGNECCVEVESENTLAELTDEALSEYE
ncbi:MAG: hypothetical protein WAX77_08885 [Methylococcaceae bacterium]